MHTQCGHTQKEATREREKKEGANLVSVVDVLVHCCSCLRETHPDIAADALGDARQNELAELAGPRRGQRRLAAPREHREPAADARDRVQARAVERAGELRDVHAAHVHAALVLARGRVLATPAVRQQLCCAPRSAEAAAAPGPPPETDAADAGAAAGAGADAGASFAVLRLLLLLLLLLLLMLLVLVWEEEERDDGVAGAEAVHAEGLARLEDDAAVRARVADAHGEREDVLRPREAHLRGRRQREAQELEEVADGLHGAERHRLAHARLGDVHARDAEARAGHCRAVRVARRVDHGLRCARGDEAGHAHARRRGLGRRGARVPLVRRVLRRCRGERAVAPVEAGRHGARVGRGVGRGARGRRARGRRGRRRGRRRPARGRERLARGGARRGAAHSARCCSAPIFLWDQPVRERSVREKRERKRVSQSRWCFFVLEILGNEREKKKNGECGVRVTE